MQFLVLVLMGKLTSLFSVQGCGDTALQSSSYSPT